MSLVKTLTVFQFLVQLQSVISQTTNASCQVSYDWANNDQDQTPCEMAMSFQGFCTDNFIIEPLLAESMYSGPTPENQSLCTCSMTFYNLLSACSDCQGGHYMTYNHWASNCTSESRSVEGRDFNSSSVGINIPTWANITYNPGPDFDPVLARIIAQNVTSSSVQATTTGEETGPATAITTAHTNTSTKKNIGAIVGGVVGGFVIVIIVACLAFWLFIRRRRARIAPSTAYRRTYGEVPPVMTIRPMSSMTTRMDSARSSQLQGFHDDKSEHRSTSNAVTIEIVNTDAKT